MAMGRPAAASASRMAVIARACCSCVPCEKFSRATSRPAAISFWSVSKDPEAGPIVQTIFVRRMDRIVAESRDLVSLVLLFWTVSDHLIYTTFDFSEERMG